MDEDVMLGDGTLEGAYTLLDDIEDALVRSYPYNDGRHITGVSNPNSDEYVTQSCISFCRPASILEPRYEDEYDPSGEFTGFAWPVFEEVFEVGFIK